MFAVDDIDETRRAFRTLNEEWIYEELPARAKDADVRGNLQQMIVDRWENPTLPSTALSHRSDHEAYRMQQIFDVLRP